MKFDLKQAEQVLRATPTTVRAMLDGLDDAWTSSETSGEEAWEPYDVVGHLIHGERTDWIPRAKIILEQGSIPTFEPFDRFAQFENSKGKRLSELLTEFESLRRQNLATLSAWGLTDEQLRLKGIHPELGEVDLAQLLATWVVHDLTHIRQIAVVTAGKYRDEVGPWREYLSILK